MKICFIVFLDCPSGFQGPYCSKKCRHPSYGIRCQSECLCEEQHCDHITGCSARSNNFAGIFSTLNYNFFLKLVSELKIEQK